MSAMRAYLLASVVALLLTLSAAQSVASLNADRVRRSNAARRSSKGGGGKGAGRSSDFRTPVARSSAAWSERPRARKTTTSIWGSLLSSRSRRRRQDGGSDEPATSLEEAARERAKLPQTLLLLQFPWTDGFNASNRIPTLLHTIGYACTLTTLNMRMVALVRPSEMHNCRQLCGTECDCAPGEHHREFGQRNIAAHATGHHDLLFAHADMWVNLRAWARGALACLDPTTSLVTAQPCPHFVATTTTQSSHDRDPPHPRSAARPR